MRYHSSLLVLHARGLSSLQRPPWVPIPANFRYYMRCHSSLLVLHARGLPSLQRPPWAPIPPVGLTYRTRGARPLATPRGSPRPPWAPFSFYTPCGCLLACHPRHTLPTALLGQLVKPVTSSSHVQVGRPSTGQPGTPPPRHHRHRRLRRLRFRNRRRSIAACQTAHHRQSQQFCPLYAVKPAQPIPHTGTPPTRPYSTW